MYRIALLRSQEEEDHLEWITSLNKVPDQIQYEIINITRNDWLNRATSKEYDIYICRPPGRNHEYKKLYDERVIILSQSLSKRLYPSLNEILIYENKRFLSYFLDASNIPHPKTYVFYDKTEAQDFAYDAPFPVIGKINIGAGGTGVMKLNSTVELLKYIDSAFSSKGIRRKWAPNLRRGYLLNRAYHRLIQPKQALSYFKKKRKAAFNDIQKNVILVQQYIKNAREWRVVRIGESFFAHKKLSVKGDLKSGTSRVEWGDPPKHLLDFVKKISDAHHLNSLALDILEDTSGKFYVLELQCYFGSKNPHQMIIDNKPGRYIFSKDRWKFEEGEFNTNNSYDLRVAHLLDSL